MTANIMVSPPYQPFTLPNKFSAVFNGEVWCGLVDKDPIIPANQVQVYVVNEDGSKTPVPQPIKLNQGGFLVYNGKPAKFVTDSNHSLLVCDSLKAQAWYEPDMARIDPDSAVDYIFNMFTNVMDSKFAGGALPSKTSLENMAAFNAAEIHANGGEIYVPDGVFQLTTPMGLGQTARYYGSGVLRFDNAEWWRRGGSSGSVSVQERYTLFYNYDKKSDVTLTYNGVPQSFTWVDDRTILAAGTESSVRVRINITNGYLPLSSTAEQIRSYNLCGNGGGGYKLEPSLPDELTSPMGYDNTSFGARAMLDIVNGVNNTGIGSKALASNKSGINNTAVGFLSLYRSSGSGNTAVGSVSGEWLTTGSYNSFLGLGSGEKVLGGSYNVGVGFEAMAEAPETKYTVAVGYRANGNPGNTSQSNSVYVGAFAGDFAVGSNNTMVGYRAGNCLDGATQEGAGTGHDNVGIGMFAMRKNLAGSESVIIGTGAAAESITTEKAVAIGYGACGVSESLGAFTVALGWNSIPSGSGDNNIAIGQQASKATTTGANNVSLGSAALSSNTTGLNNTALGFNSGRLKQDGTTTVALINTTTVGNDARVSGDNQVQLGNAATTTYVYGTVQNRSDANDKADVVDTALGIDFIMGLRPVDGRWDLRDDYMKEEEYQELEIIEVPVYDGDQVIDYSKEERLVTKTRIIHLPKDGSKKRERLHHWFIAQEVKELCDKLGVEFGGYQDHSIKGGCDVLSLGYDEFIPPTVKAVQQCWERLNDLEERIKILESK